MFGGSHRAGTPYACIRSSVYTEGVLFRIVSIACCLATLPAWNVITSQFSPSHPGGHRATLHSSARSLELDVAAATHPQQKDGTTAARQRVHASPVASVDRHILWHRIQFLVLCVIFVSPVWCVKNSSSAH